MCKLFFTFFVVKLNSGRRHKAKCKRNDTQRRTYIESEAEGRQQRKSYDNDLKLEEWWREYSDEKRAKKIILIAVAAAAFGCCFYRFS
jgi:uncharacterized protein HemY